MSSNPRLRLEEIAKGDPTYASDWKMMRRMRITLVVQQHIEQGPEREAIALRMPHVDSVMRGYWGICDMNSPQFKAWNEWMERRAKLRGCNKLVASRAGNWMPA